MSAYGIEPQGGKSKAIKEMEAPSDISGLRVLVGLLSYYKKIFLRNDIKAPFINKLLKKEGEQVAMGARGERSTREAKGGIVW